MNYWLACFAAMAFGYFLSINDSYAMRDCMAAHSESTCFQLINR